MRPPNLLGRYITGTTTRTEFNGLLLPPSPEQVHVAPEDGGAEPQTENSDLSFPRRPSEFSRPILVTR